MLNQATSVEVLLRVKGPPYCWPEVGILIAHPETEAPRLPIHAEHIHPAGPCGQQIEAFQMGMHSTMALGPLLLLLMMMMPGPIGLLVAPLCTSRLPVRPLPGLHHTDTALAALDLCRQNPAASRPRPARMVT